MSVHEIQFTPGIVLPESLYLDSNVLIAFFDKNHQSHLKASQLLLEAKTSNVNIYISSLVLDEVWYVLMRSWQRQELDINFNSKNKAHLQLYAPCLERITNDILDLLQAKLLPLENQKSLDIVQFALKLLVEEHLAPKNSYHLAYLITAGIPGFATIDSDFMPIKNPSIDLSIIKV